MDILQAGIYLILFLILFEVILIVLLFMLWVFLAAVGVMLWTTLQVARLFTGKGKRKIKRGLTGPGQSQGLAFIRRAFCRVKVLCTLDAAPGHAQPHNLRRTSHRPSFPGDAKDKPPASEGSKKFFASFFQKRRESFVRLPGCVDSSQVLQPTDEQPDKMEQIQQWNAR